MDKANHRRTGKRHNKPRQEISPFLKWLIFAICTINFIISFVITLVCIYMTIKDSHEFKFIDFIFNPFVVFSVFGITTCFTSILGVMGSLRENVYLLKIFGCIIFLGYFLLLTLTLLVFSLFYFDSGNVILARSILSIAIKNYHKSNNLAELVDSMQTNLHCCGVSSMTRGYRDWNTSHLFQCSDGNPLPEKCGVPFSCCKESILQNSLLSSTSGRTKSSLECWRNALSRHASDVEDNIYTQGCLSPFKTIVSSYATHVVVIVSLLIIPVSVFICLTNILAKQVDHQKMLLEREARRAERRRKRELKMILNSNKQLKAEDAHAQGNSTELRNVTELEETTNNSK